MIASARRSFVAWVCVGIAAFALLGAAFPPAYAAAAGSGRAASETRSVAGFEAIAVAGAIDLVVRQTGRESVEVHAAADVLPLVETVVEDTARGRTLFVRLKRGASVRTKTDVRVTVDVARLTQLASAGSGTVLVQGLDTPALRLVLSGSADATLRELAAGVLDVRVAGSGNVEAAGTAQQVKVSIAGSGNVSLARLPADDVKVSIAGSGDAKVVANKALGVSIAGSGDVVYSGSAESIRTSVAGSGRITKR